MKKEAQQFRRAVLPMRDILNPIIRKDIELFPDADLDYFRDVYDHSVLVMDQLDSLRDIVNSALEIHLSVVGNRQNEVAKQLTVIATIFLPLTFLTGFFGQNFRFLVNDVMVHDWTFWLLGVGTEVLALFLTLGYFRLKGWF
jgi:magnesium transporter